MGVIDLQNIDFIYQDPLPQACCPHLNKFARYKQRNFSEGCAGDFKCTVPASVTMSEKLPALGLLLVMLRVVWASCPNGRGESRVVNGLVDLRSSGHLTFYKLSFIIQLLGAPLEDQTGRLDFKIEMLERSGVFKR